MQPAVEIGLCLRSVGYGTLVPSYEIRASLRALPGAATRLVSELSNRIAEPGKLITIVSEGRAELIWNVVRL